MILSAEDQTTKKKSKQLKICRQAISRAISHFIDMIMYSEFFPSPLRNVIILPFPLFPANNSRT